MPDAIRNPTSQECIKISCELQQHNRKLLCLCDRLEEVADSLPDKIDTQECLLLARSLYPAVYKAHQFEEIVLFPVLAGHNPDPALKNSFERLKFEHWEDEAFAEEISECLKRYILVPENSDTLAYMLRGFFESVRRHVAFDTEHLLPKLEVCST